MPKTDVTEERGLSRLQGIDLREHAHQNTAHDCVNLRLDNASRLSNYFRPTKVKSGSYSFACESKDPSLHEFDYALDGCLGTITVTGQSGFDDNKKVKIKGSHLQLVDKVILVSEDGTAIESGQDFGYYLDGGDIVLEIYLSEYSKFETLILRNAYGIYSVAVEIGEKTNKVLIIGNRYKLGVDNETLEFCIWQKSGSSWIKLAAYGSPSATPWIEGAELKDEQTSGLCFASGGYYWSFTSAETALSLKIADTYWGEWGQMIVNSSFVQQWGTASGEFDYTEVVEPVEKYTFGTFETYRLRATGNNSLVLEMKSDSTTNTYDITLMEWHYEQ